MTKIKIEELTDISFAPYGRVVQNSSSTPTKDGDGWKCFSHVDFMLTDKSIGIGIVYSDKYPKEVKALERHVSREELLWATTEDLVMVVDLPLYLGEESAKPDPQTTKAFLIKAGQVIVINRGTWHSPAFGLNGETKYFFAIENKKDFIDQDDQPWINFKEDVTVTIEG